jgi:hypothetical protein
MLVSQWQRSRWACSSSGCCLSPTLTVSKAAGGYAGVAMAEIALGLFVVGVLFIADPDRLQMVIDQMRELIAWLAE